MVTPAPVDPFNLPSKWMGDGKVKIKDSSPSNSTARNASFSLASHHMRIAEAANVMELTMYDAKNKKVMMHEFHVSPSQLSIDQPARVGVYQTLSGDAYVDHLGAGLPTITMSGTIGPSPLLGPIGWVQFTMLREFVETYYDRCRAGNAQGTRLILSIDFNDSPHFGQWEVTIVNFKIERSAKSPLTHSYAISFSALDSKSSANLHKFDVYREKRKNLITKFWDDDLGEGRARPGFSRGRIEPPPITVVNQINPLYLPDKYVWIRTESKPTIIQYKKLYNYTYPENQTIGETWRYFDSGPTIVDKKLSLGPFGMATHAYAINSDSTTAGFSGNASINGYGLTITNGSGNLTVGQTISGSGIIVGTRIANVTSSSDGVTYQIDTYHEDAITNSPVEGWVFTNQMTEGDSEIFLNITSSSSQKGSLNVTIGSLYSPEVLGKMTKARFYGPVLTNDAQFVDMYEEDIQLEASNAVQLKDTILMSTLPSGGINVNFGIKIINKFPLYNENIDEDKRPYQSEEEQKLSGLDNLSYNEYCNTKRQSILEIIKKSYPTISNLEESQINEIATWIAVQSNITVSFTEKLPWATVLHIPPSVRSI